MNSPASFDRIAAHRSFSSDCFNRAWDILDQPGRSAEDDAMLLHLVHASLWHWLQCDDCKPRNLSIGYWQISRAYTVTGDAALARRFGEICLKHSAGEPPFFIAYAHEALARAAKLGGDHPSWEKHLAEARRLAALIAEADDRASLEKDLDTLAG